MFSLGALSSMLLCLALGTNAATLHSIEKRQANFECSSEQTQISSPWLYVDGTDCGTLIGQITDFYNDDYRGECQRWQGLDKTPHRIGDAYIDECFQFPNGTTRYRSKICCEGLVTSQRCMTCLNGTLSYDSQTGYHVEGCNHYGQVETCPSGQSCRTTFTHYNSAASSGRCSVRRFVNKMCAPSDECQADATANSQTCKSGIDHATCTYCCKGPFCNYKTPIARPHACSACDASPCSGGGTCVANETLSAGYYCICPPHRYGDRCQYNGCYKRPCQNKGYCLGQRNAPYYQCHCRVGWTGENCTEAYDRCTSDYCLNGGSCYDHKDYGLRCLCPDGFAGAKCEIENKVCRVPALMYSYNGESIGNYKKNCTQMQDYFERIKNNYLNTCKSKFRWNKFATVKELAAISVHTCERGDNYNFFKLEFCCPACYSNPCQNGGWCVESGNQEYICKCRYGYEGRYCENKVASCFATGDPHYKTFDGQMIHFQGQCKYTLASKCEGSQFSDLEDFQVYVQNEHRNGDTTFTYVKYVETHVFGHVIKMDRDNEISVDGSLVTPDVSYPGFKIIRNGKYIRLETNFSLSVENDGQWTAFVKIAPQYAGAMCGICGNFDGNAVNDYTQRDGSDVSLKEDRDYLVADSWYITDESNPSCDRTQAEIPKCDEQMQAAIASNRFCGLIKDKTSPFDTCLNRGIVSRDDFYLSCEYDTCAFMPNQTLAKMASCRNLAVLADTCEQHGIIVDWRKLANCPLDCGENMTYVRQGSACPVTCENPDADEICALPDTETCVCPLGTLMKDGKCVEPSECGCTYKGKRFDIGDTWSTSECEIFNCTVCEDCVYQVGKVVQVTDGCETGQECVSSQCQSTTTVPPSTTTTTTTTTTVSTTTKETTMKPFTTQEDTTLNPVTTNEETTQEESTTAIPNEPCHYEFKPSDCEKCRAISNEAGYLAHPCKCSTYIQCEKVNDVWTQGHFRDCPPCTCWNQDTLTCELTGEDCQQINETNSEESVSSDSDSCTKGSNTYTAHKEITKYNWVTVTGKVEMACPCGTVFSLTECGCVQKDGFDCNLPDEVTCLSFDAGWNGFQATNWVWVSSGGVQIDPNGVKGSCGRFDGKSKLEIPFFTNAYSAYSEFTVSFWYKRQGGASTEQGLFSNMDCSQQKSIEIRSEDDGLVGGGIKTSEKNIIDGFSGIKAEYDEWHHVVLSYNGAKVDFYLDNVKQQPSDLETTGTLANSQCPLVIGSMFGDKFFTGLIDEVCIYKAGLSAEKVASLYNSVRGNIQ